MKRKALGKGLEAIFGELEPASKEVINLKIESIEPNPFQPRENFDEKGLQELAASIKKQGVLQPILVRKHGEKYQLIAGERRWRAAIKAGLKEIPAMVMKASDEELLMLTLIENLQREDLNPIEEAKAYKTLQEKFGFTQEEIAEKVGKERSTVANALRLLKLPPIIQEAIANGEISAGHAKVLVSLPPEEQLKLFKQIKEKKLSVREVEKASKEKKQKVENVYSDLEELLTSILESKVKIKPKKIEIFYNGKEHLERIIDLLTSIKSV